MSRFARTRRVFFVEEPIFEGDKPQMRTEVDANSGVAVLTPVLPPGLSSPEVVQQQRVLLTEALHQHKISDYIAWYYTPMAMEFTSGLDPVVTIYDCMDELSAFAGAPPMMRSNEEALFRQADFVFTGGASLYAGKKSQHASVHLFPSSIDTSHFVKARTQNHPPADQRDIALPRFGYSGVIDERMDLDLVAKLAERREQWQFVFLGPVVKIPESALPKARNLHFLGMKKYDELPSYMAGWSVGILPFALNESTRFISPTKTPEYLAAGLRVISTPIRDVVSPYGELGLAEIISTPKEFVAAGEKLLVESSSPAFRARADEFLSRSSWDQTWEAMDRLIQSRIAERSTNLTTQGLLNV